MSRVSCLREFSAIIFNPRSRFPKSSDKTILLIADSLRHNVCPIILLFCPILVFVEEFL